MLSVDGSWTQFEWVCVWMNYVKSPNRVFCKHERESDSNGWEKLFQIGKMENQGQMDVCWKA